MSNKLWAVLLVATCTLFIGLLVARLVRSAGGDQPMRATDHFQVNECVELINVQDPNTNERYLVAWNKCGATNVAITSR